jgi:hypothetical protein
MAVIGFHIIIPSTEENQPRPPEWLRAEVF